MNLTKLKEIIDWETITLKQIKGGLKFTFITPSIAPNYKFTIKVLINGLLTTVVQINLNDNTYAGTDDLTEEWEQFLKLCMQNHREKTETHKSNTRQLAADILYSK